MKIIYFTIILLLPIFTIRLYSMENTAASETMTTYNHKTIRQKLIDTIVIDIPSKKLDITVSNPQWNPTMDYFAVVDDHSVSLYETKTMKQIHQFLTDYKDKQFQWFTDIEIGLRAADCKTITYCVLQKNSNTLYLFNTDSAQEWEYNVGDDIQSINWHPISAALIIATKESIILYDAQQKEIITTIENTQPHTSITAACINIHETIAFRLSNNTLYTYQLPNFSLNKCTAPQRFTPAISSPQCIITSHFYSPNGRYLITLCNTSMHVYDTTPENQPASYLFNKKSFTTKTDNCWNLDSTYLIVDTADGITTVWNSNTKQLFTLSNSARSNVITAYSWSPEGGYLATGSIDGTICLWDISNKVCIKTLPSIGSGIKALYWTSTNRLTSIYENNTIYQWNTKNIYSVYDKNKSISSLWYYKFKKDFSYYAPYATRIGLLAGTGYGLYYWVTNATKIIRPEIIP